MTLLLEAGDGKKADVEDVVIKSGITGYHFHKDMMDIDRVLEINIGN
jgi:hypothetical protein